MNFKNCTLWLMSIMLIAQTSLFSTDTIADTQLNKLDGVGDWVGVLETPKGNLTLWLSVERLADGELLATLESPDQAPGKKMAVKDLDFQSDKLIFSIPRISAKYAGDWDVKNQLWRGTFTQGQSFKLSFSRGKPKSKPIYTKLNGHWQGEIMGHPLIVRITSTEVGTLAVLDSPDEGVKNLQISNLILKARSISFEIPRAGVTFEGTLNKIDKQFSGHWVQKGQPKREITFIKQTNGITQNKPNRPQHPVGKQPYISKLVTFKNNQAKGIELAATLTLPEGDGPFPAAILISGSGPSDRDESFMGHKPFAVIADHLTRQGIAVLRYDDRGVGKSKGAHNAATSLDFSSDANAAFDFLLSHAEIDVNAIGMIGHSEGGLIAPLAANTNKKLAFIILLAGPGINTVELMLAQQKAMAELQGIEQEKLTQKQRLARLIMEKVSASETLESANKSVSDILTADNLIILGVQENQKQAIVGNYTRPWFRYFMTYDPAHYFTEKALPILALGGELDVQVTSKENLAGLRKILKGHDDATIKLLPGLNHMFQRAKTGSINEYRQIEQTFAPDALSLISSWIKVRF